MAVNESIDEKIDFVRKLRGETLKDLYVFAMADALIVKAESKGDRNIGAEKRRHNAAVRICATFNGLATSRFSSNVR